MTPPPPLTTPVLAMHPKHLPFNHTRISTASQPLMIPTSPFHHTRHIQASQPPMISTSPFQPTYLPSDFTSARSETASTIAVGFSSSTSASSTSASSSSSSSCSSYRSSSFNSSSSSPAPKNRLKRRRRSVGPPPETTFALSVITPIKKGVTLKTGSTKRFFWPQEGTIFLSS